jgi:hypothetical protein
MEKAVEPLCSLLDVMMDTIQVIITLPNDVEKTVTLTRITELIRHEGYCTLYLYSPIYSLFTPLFLHNIFATLWLDFGIFYYLGIETSTQKFPESPVCDKIFTRGLVSLELSRVNPAPDACNTNIKSVRNFRYTVTFFP